MTQFTLKISKEEADYIKSGQKSFIFRELKYKYSAGDVITFIVVKNGKPVSDPISNEQYAISYVATHNEAPIARGWVVLGIQRIKPRVTLNTDCAWR